MKNYNEIATSVFERREQYEIGKQHKRKIIIRAMIPVCCFSFMFLLGIGLWQGGMFHTTPPQTSDDAIYQGMKDNFDEQNGESPDNPAANNKIVINNIGAFSVDKMNIALLGDDFIKMDRAAVNAYYGINVFPEVPADIPGWQDAAYGIYRRDGGTGETYWDQMVLNYDNEDFSRGVNIEVKKGALPFLDYGFGKSAEEKSIINNWEVAIGLSESGYYHAIFMYQNVGFCVNARGLTQSEFVAVLSSIIK